MKKSSISVHFDNLAPLYDQYKNKNRIYYDTLKRAIDKEIICRDSKILDIGCGTGSILAYLIPKRGVGIDMSQKMIIRAKQKYFLVKSLAFYVYNIEKKPFKGNFDYILFNDVIEHVENQNQALKNIYLSMNKNTKLILSMANLLWEPLLIILEKLHLKMPEGPHQRITEKNLINLLNKNYLEVISKKVYLPQINFPIISNLGLLYVYTIKRVA